MPTSLAIIQILLCVINDATNNLYLTGNNVTFHIGDHQCRCDCALENTWNTRNHIIDSQQHLNVIFRELIPWVYYDKKQRPIGFLVELWFSVENTFS